MADLTEYVEEYMSPDGIYTAYASPDGMAATLTKNGIPIKTFKGETAHMDVVRVAEDMYYDSRR